MTHQLTLLSRYYQYLLLWFPIKKKKIHWAVWSQMNDMTKFKRPPILAGWKIISSAIGKMTLWARRRTLDTLASSHEAVPKRPCSEQRLVWWRQQISLWFMGKEKRILALKRTWFFYYCHCQFLLTLQPGWPGCQVWRWVQNDAGNLHLQQEMIFISPLDLSETVAGLSGLHPRGLDRTLWTDWHELTASSFSRSAQTESS